jgi:hypothetical protein
MSSHSSNSSVTSSEGPGQEYFPGYLCPELPELEKDIDGDDAGGREEEAPVESHSDLYSYWVGCFRIVSSRLLWFS